MTDTSSWSSLSPRVRARLRLAVLVRDEYVCQLRLAGCVLTATHADHINRRETHGDGLDNLQASCQPCNLKKGQPKPSDPKHEPPAGSWW